MDAGSLFLFTLTVINLPMWLSILASWLHCFQEVKGGFLSYFLSVSPRYKPVTLKAPRPLLALAFGPVLASTLTILAVVGWSALDKPEQGGVQSLALAALCGARIGDSFYSHWFLALHKPGNPGLSTTFLYTMEAGLIFVTVSWGLAELSLLILAAQSFWIINPLIGVITIREEE